MKLTIQYIAGFIDGEGYLGIIKKSTKACPLGYYFVPALKINQLETNDAVLREITKFFGYGNLTLERRKQEKYKNRATQTALEFRGMKRVIPIVKKLYPYLIVKKRQAETLMEFGKLPRVKAKDEYNIYGKKSILYDKIRSLNNKHRLAETKRKEAEKSVMQ